MTDRSIEAFFPRFKEILKEGGKSSSQKRIRRTIHRNLEKNAQPQLFSKSTYLTQMFERLHILLFIFHG